MLSKRPNILFSDFFGVDKEVLDDYGCFNISLVADLPLFIDPFLLFNSTNPDYQKLHEEIIRYLKFLRDKSIQGEIPSGLLTAWYKFREIEQNWLGYSLANNQGTGLGNSFAKALNESFNKIFTDYGEERITRGTHLEKLCLIKDGVGKDNISDFTTNLIKHFLLRYTETFARNHLKPEVCRVFRVPRAYFSYDTETWVENTYYLPNYRDDFVILTPKDILTKDSTWISRADMIAVFHQIPEAITNIELREAVNNYLRKILPPSPSEKDWKEAVKKTIDEYPQLVDYYIKIKEDNGDEAESNSTEKVVASEDLYLSRFVELATRLANTSFYTMPSNSYDEIVKRVLFLKNEIENNDVYRLFYDKHTKLPIEREEDLKLCFRLTWYDSGYDFNTEVNNGRGPVDGKASKGSADSALIEFKLASNKKLEQNLAHQTSIYEKANRTNLCVKVIIYFTKNELLRVNTILKKLSLEKDESIILIDARSDNKTSASNVQ